MLDATDETRIGRLNPVDDHAFAGNIAVELIDPLSLEDARRTGKYADADAVVKGLQRKLDAARARKRATSR